ncbi:glia-derived nexin-like [Physella acuta]|uniref:glia-derived nexin-like n=1 Tax=Physella acuta TaxID=109671 RepID=UPI0027DE945D|nr:glia-derived nexin-like [Physella acuta]
MPFNTSGAGVKMVPSMRQSKVFRYANHYDTEVVELMFEGDVLAMYVLLPGVNSSLVQLLEFLNDTQGHPIHPLESLLDDLEEKYVALTLPRFTIETGSVDLVEPLTSLGLRKLFDPVLADFSRISDANMHVQSVKQKSYIQVNEDGCVAAAVTVVGKALIGGLSGEVWLDVNRPFLFIIRDTNVKATLFMGAFLGQTRSDTFQTK